MKKCIKSLFFIVIIGVCSLSSASNSAAVHLTSDPVTLHDSWETSYGIYLNTNHIYMNIQVWESLIWHPNFQNALKTGYVPGQIHLKLVLIKSRLQLRFHGATYTSVKSWQFLVTACMVYISACIYTACLELFFVHTPRQYVKSFPRKPSELQAPHKD